MKEDKNMDTAVINRNNCFRPLSYEEEIQVNGGFAWLIVAGIVVCVILVAAFAYGCYVGYNTH